MKDNCWLFLKNKLCEFSEIIFLKKSMGKEIEEILIDLIKI